MHCPRCHLFLKQEMHEGTSYHYCDCCQGVWFSGKRRWKDLRSFIQSDNVPRVLNEADKPTLVHKDVGQIIHCPIHGHGSLKRIFKDFIHMHLCKKHYGIWIDRMELSHMRETCYPDPYIFPLMIINITMTFGTFIEILMGVELDNSK